jgi:hypothetical protein
VLECSAVRPASDWVALHAGCACAVVLLTCCARRVQVRVLQAFWTRIVNRSRVPHLLRTLPHAAQILAGHKLGWKTVMSLHSPDASYVLDLRRPDDADVGARLFRCGADIRGRCVNNLLVNGARALLPALAPRSLFAVFSARSLRCRRTTASWAEQTADVVPKL